MCPSLRKDRKTVAWHTLGRDRIEQDQENTHMNDSNIKEYLSQIGIRKISELDTALLETYGEIEGRRHIEKLTELFDQSEGRLVYGSGDTLYLHRQDELVDYWNQSLPLSILAASFYDRVFFRRVMAYLVQYDTFLGGDILDMGCGNGILTCFLALLHPDTSVTGLDLSQNAVSTATELSKTLHLNNIQLIRPSGHLQKKYDTLFSCRTVHENIAWKPLCEEPKAAILSIEELTRRHKKYAAELSAMIKSHGYLISVERYDDDNTYAGLVNAFNRSGLCPIRSTHIQFSCKNGDGTATFQAMVFEKTEV